MQPHVKHKERRQPSVHNPRRQVKLNMTNDKGRQPFPASSSPSTVTNKENKEVPSDLVLLPC